MDFDKLHREVMLPSVRIRAQRATGSGTIIYSKENAKGKYSVYALTNHHVIKESIALEERWSTLLKKKVEMDVFQTVEVHLFKYLWSSRSKGGETVLADIVAYDV